MGSSFIQAIKGIHLDPMIPYTAKMTKFHAGSDSGNIIPGNANFNIDLRAQTNEVMKELIEKINEISESVAKAARCYDNTRDKSDRSSCTS
ncbi:peptidase dimerization domain-containing protein [Robertmurraya sp. FSL R5-0851]|uniref:peptidase dimerization domain-containing protein n=1 Tax=Robertmurraya sp. FSL R5-0851 TaxID=2921584 RepID=UPI0030F8FCF8